MAPAFQTLRPCQRTKPIVRSPRQERLLQQQGPVSYRHVPVGMVGWPACRERGQQAERSGPRAERARESQVVGALLRTPLPKPDPQVLFSDKEAPALKYLQGCLQ